MEYGVIFEAAFSPLVHWVSRSSHFQRIHRSIAEFFNCGLSQTARQERSLSGLGLWLLGWTGESLSVRASRENCGADRILSLLLLSYSWTSNHQEVHSSCVSLKQVTASYANGKGSTRCARIHLAGRPAWAISKMHRSTRQLVHYAHSRYKYSMSSDMTLALHRADMPKDRTVPEEVISTLRRIKFMNYPRRKGLARIYETGNVLRVAFF